MSDSKLDLLRLLEYRSSGLLTNIPGVAGVGENDDGVLAGVAELLSVIVCVSLVSRLRNPKTPLFFRSLLNLEPCSTGNLTDDAGVGSPASL